MPYFSCRGISTSLTDNVNYPREYVRYLNERARNYPPYGGAGTPLEFSTPKERSRSVVQIGNEIVHLTKEAAAEILRQYRNIKAQAGKTLTIYTASKMVIVREKELQAIIERLQEIAIN